jgi:hypothetical protein
MILFVSNNDNYMLTQNTKQLGQASETPHSNTGSNRQITTEEGLDGHLDYLVVCGYGDVVQLCDAIWSTFGTNFDWHGAKGGMRGKYYEAIVKSAQGIEIAVNHSTTDKNHGSFRLSIPGRPLQHVRSEQTHKLGRYLYKHGYRCTRFDWAIDDYSHLLCMDEIQAACARGDYSGAASHRYFQRQKRGEYKVGRTIYLGSSQSDKQVRIYDKNIESKGQINSIRYEVQWRDALAQIAFEKFFSIGRPEDGCKALSMLAVGAVAFYQRRDAVLSRSEPLSVWDGFVARVGGFVKMSKRVLQPMISTKIAWIEAQVSGTIALITKIKGFDETFNWLERIVREKLGFMSTDKIMFVDSWFDRLQVERGDFDDWMVIKEWERV